MGFNEKLAAAKEKGRPFKTVTVSLDAEVSAKLADIEARLDDEQRKPDDGRLAKKSAASKLQADAERMRAEFADTLVDLKFTRLVGNDWTELVVTNPPRDNVLPDIAYFGYNFSAVTAEAARQSGVIVEGDEERALTAEEWDDLFSLISGGDHKNIADAVYALNEGEAARAVELGKALRAATIDSAKKSS